MSRQILMALMPFGLIACSAPPLSVQQMSEALSSELAAASAATAEPVALSDGFLSALVQAVEMNAGYRAALAQEREAASRSGVAESVRRPQLSADANLGGLRKFGAVGKTTTGISGGISLSQLIYDGGESTAAVNRATAEAIGARAERVVQANTLALDAAQAWIDIWQFDERLRLLRSRTSDMEAMVGQMERMAASGLVDRAALDSARRQIVGVQLEQTRLEIELADAQVRFRRHFRQTPGRLPRPSEIITPALALAQVDAWHNAPSLQARAANVIAARHGVEEAEAAFYPRVRLQTGLRTPMDAADPTGGTFGLGFEYRFFDGQRRVYQLEAAIARRMAEEEQMQEEQTRLEADLAAATTRLSGIDRSMSLVAEQISLSASEAEMARSQITTGQSTLRQLVDAEVSNYRAQDSQLAMQAERQMLLLTIAGLTGELGRRIGLDVNPLEDERAALSYDAQD